MLCFKRIEMFNFENYTNVSRETFQVFVLIFLSTKMFT